MTPLEPIPTLFVLVQDGCPACEEAEPALAQLVRYHSLDVLVIPLHINRRDWRLASLRWAPRYTPGYALVEGGEIVQKHEGAMGYEELVKWLWPVEETDDA